MVAEVWVSIDSSNRLWPECTKQFSKADINLLLEVLFEIHQEQILQEVLIYSYVTCVLVITFLKSISYRTGYNESNFTEIITLYLMYVNFNECYIDNHYCQANSCGILTAGVHIDIPNRLSCWLGVQNLA